MMNTNEGFFKIWMKSNIYKSRKWDAIFYLVLYLIIPVFIAGISIDSIHETDTIALIYFYLSTCISASGCVYDVAGRWTVNRKSIMNLKLLLIALSVFIIMCYCGFEIFSLLIAKKFVFRCDALLWFYVLPWLIGIVDLGYCFIRDIAIKEYVDFEK